MMTSGSGEGWFLEMDERRIDLREGEVTLGRSRGCGVVLRDPSVSRGHALLSMRQGRVTLQDLRSSNGTYVNGKRLEKETTLEAGDRLVIGETELFLHRAGESQGSTGRRVETGEAILFCVACGRPVRRPLSRLRRGARGRPPPRGGSGGVGSGGGLPGTPDLRRRRPRIAGGLRPAGAPGANADSDPGARRRRSRLHRRDPAARRERRRGAAAGPPLRGAHVGPRGGGPGSRRPGARGHPLPPDPRATAPSRPTGPVVPADPPSPRGLRGREDSAARRC
jgi:FHA domain